MIIPGFLISVLTFPGVIVHEFGHKVFCDYADVPVHKVCYFRLGNPAGYVIHERPRTFFSAFLVTAGPFIAGTTISFLIFLLYWYLYPEPGVFSVSALGLIWLGISVALHAFPSSTDAKNLWHETNAHILRNPLAIIGYPVVIIIYIAHFLKVVWIDLVYAVALFALAGFILNGPTGG
jgi:hypothetical protein